MSNVVQIVDFQTDIEKPFPISARELWKGLGIQDNFSNWIVEQVSRAKLNESTDYLINREKPANSGRGRPTKEYYLTVSAAKNIALMSNTDKGSQYRKALIKLEEKYFSGELTAPSIDKIIDANRAMEAMMGICSALEIPKHLAQIESVKRTKQVTGFDLSGLLSLAPAQDNIVESEVMLEPTECAKQLCLKSGTELNKLLEQAGLQKKTNTGWEPTSQATGKFSKHSWSRGSKSGYNLKWNLDFVKQTLGF